MPVPVPNLDDRTYDDLVAEALRLIPSVGPEWTDHNASDPGITLIEMLAYVTEMLIYRVNRVAEPNTIAFLRLLKGDPQWQPSKSAKDELREIMQVLRTEERAVTAGDFVRHATAVKNKEGAQLVARAHCLPRRNLEAPDRPTERPGHVSVIVVPEDNPPEDVIVLVAQDLEERRLLTTRVHVVPPRYLRVNVQLTIHLRLDANEDTAKDKINSTLQDFFNGGADGSGWQFGRSVYVSEIYALLDRLDVVDFVDRTDDNDELTCDGAEIRIIDRLPPEKPERRGRLVGLWLHPDELVQAGSFNIAIESPNPDPFVVARERRR